MNHSTDVLRHKKEFGRLAHVKNRISIAEQKQIKQLYATGRYTMQELAGIYNTKQQDISTIIHLKTEEEEYWKI